MSKAWTLQALLALASLPWLGVYAWALARAAVKGAGRVTDLLYNLGVLTNVTWAAMIFVPQPRFPGILEPHRLTEQPAVVAPVGLGVALVVVFAVRNVRAMSDNAASVKRHYAQPATLLTSGPYARVRNPMNAGGMFLFIGLCLATGASHTALLFPAYVAVTDVFTVLEERIALRPTFGARFSEYAAAVPRYFDARGKALLLAAATAVAVEWFWLKAR